MTILHVIEPFASGVTTFLVHLTTYLPQHRHIIFHGSRTSSDTEKKVKERFIQPVEFVHWKHVQREVHLWMDIKAFFSLVKVLRSSSYDIVHLHSSKAGFLGRLACFLLNKKHVVYTPHAAPFLRKDISSTTRLLYITLEKIGAKLGGIIVSCCPHERADYSNIKIKSRCINNGVPLTEINKRTDSKLTVVCSGLIVRQKNPALFNSIASHFVRTENVQFIWIGEGDLRQELVAPNIFVTGWIAPAEIKPYLEKADLYLATSAWEGMPYAVLEAMNAECCLLLSRTGGHVDAVLQNQNGLLFDTAKEAVQFIMHHLYLHEPLLTMGKKSKELCRDFFSAERMAQGYHELYTLIR